MKIAVAARHGVLVSHDTAQCEVFAIFLVEDGSITGTHLRTSGAFAQEGGRRLVDMISDVDVVMAGAFNRGLIRDLDRAGIRAVVTEQADAETAVRCYIELPAEEPG